MIICESTDCPLPGKPVVTIGNFDGVHLGHRSVFSAMREAADRMGHASTVVTFRQHPRRVLYPDLPIKYLSSIDERIALFAECGVDAVIILDFTLETARVSAVDFIRDEISGVLGASAVVIGYDHAFGHNREGNVDNLTALGERCNFEVMSIPPFIVDGHPVSSSRIRAGLEAGNVADARNCLGRYYSVSGTVVKGFQRGKTIGFPTANLLVQDDAKIVPAFGVYAVRVKLQDRIFGGMTSIGTNPTFGAGVRTVETNIFDFNEDIYNESITVEFVERLRDEKKFTGVSDLVKAIHADEVDARRILAALD